MNEAEIRMITNYAIPTAMSLQQVQDVTLTDATMIRLVELIHSGKWYEANKPSANVDTNFIMRCARIKDELTTTRERDIVLWGHRIVLPKSLQQQVISLAHSGHQGLLKTKQLLHTKVWFPDIDKLVMSSCHRLQTPPALTNDRASNS